MKYRCRKCLVILDEDELVKQTDYESYEFWGANVQEKFVYWYCPYCAEEITEYDEYDDEDDEE